jgi:hypothetical protein
MEERVGESIEDPLVTTINEGFSIIKGIRSYKVIEDSH